MQNVVHCANNEDDVRASNISKRTTNSRQGSINSNKKPSSKRTAVSSNKIAISPIGYQDNLTPGDCDTFQLN